MHVKYMISGNEFYLYYHAIFFIVGYFAFFYSLELDFRRPGAIYKVFDRNATTIVILSLFLLIGLRAYNVGTDTGNYYHKWLQNDKFVFSSDFLFYALMSFIQKIGLSYQVFLLAVSLIYFGVMYVAFKRFSDRYKVSLFLLFFTFFSLFFSLSTSINVVRQGLSLVFLVLAYVYLINGNKKEGIISLLCAIGFHLTAVIPVLLFIAVKGLHKVNLIWFTLIYLIGILLSYINIGIMDVAPFLSDVLISIEDKRVSYLSASSESRYIVGFKPQFVIFNSVFLIIFFYLRKIVDEKSMYDTLLKYFLLSSFVFFMAFQIPFSDRWGLFSWFAIPLLFSPAFKYKIKGPIKLKTISVVFLIFVFWFFNIYSK